VAFSIDMLLGVGQPASWWIGLSGGSVMLSVDVINSSPTSTPKPTPLMPLVSSSVFAARFRLLIHSKRILFKSLDFVVMRFLVKLFCMSNIDIVNECRMYCGFKLPSKIIPTSIDKFMSKLSYVVNCCFFL